MAFCAIVLAKTFQRTTATEVMAVLPEGYTIENSCVVALRNSVAVAGISIIHNNIVLYPTRFDNTGTAKIFVDEFERKNPEVKFKEQSDG